MLHRHVHRVAGKFCVRRFGPRVVTRCLSDHLFELRDLLSRKLEVLHESRVRFFRNDTFDVTENVTVQLQHQEGQKAIFARFLGIRERSGVLELSVEYRGFEVQEPSWMPVCELVSEVPQILREYLAERKVAGSQTQARLAAKAVALQMIASHFERARGGDGDFHRQRIRAERACFYGSSLVGYALREVCSVPGKSGVFT